MRPASQNPYPIYDLTLKSTPCFRPALKLFPLFRPMLKAMFNGGEEGKTRMEAGGHDKEVISSKFNTSIQKLIPYL